MLMRYTGVIMQTRLNCGQDIGQCLSFDLFDTDRLRSIAAVQFDTSPVADYQQLCGTVAVSDRARAILGLQQR